MLAELKPILSLAFIECLPVFFVLTVLSLSRQSTKPLYAALLLFLAVVTSTLALFLQPVPVLSHTEFNWQGKILNFLWPCLLVYGCSCLSVNDVGLSLPKQSSDFRLAILLGTVLAFLASLIELLAGVSVDQMNLGTLLFESTIPGLDEEITYRGVFLAALNRYLAKPWRVGKTQFGWGVLLVTLLFVMAHFVHIDNKTHQVIWVNKGYINLFLLSTIGLALGFIREKSGSIWPAVLLHNIANVLCYMIECLFS